MSILKIRLPYLINQIPLAFLLAFPQPSLQFISPFTEMYSTLCQTPKQERFVKMIKG